MTDYSKLKVAELKELVKERGITASGLKLKQQFIDALAAADTEGKTEEPAQEAQDDAPAKTVDPVENVETVDQPAEVEEPKQEPKQALADDGNRMDVDEEGAVKPVEEVAEDVKADEPMGDAKVEQEQETDAESNKRKRRSPTPPLREESVSKKIKTAQEVPALPEDFQDSKVTEKDDVEDVKDVGQVEDVKNVGKVEDVGPTEDAFMSDMTSTAPSQHSATRALYIRNLVRPLQPPVLRDHLLTVASPPNSDIDTSIIEVSHVDKLRSHAFVLFSSISAASRARSALHDQIWPPEPMRKPLFADFIPEEKFAEWVDLETSRERENLRWEVVYTPVKAEDGSTVVTASLQEASASRQPTQNHMRNDGAPPTGPRASLAGEGMPNAPSGPRTVQTPQPQNIPEPTQSKSFTTLDASYKFTETKPKLYWQPVNPELAAKRQDELERETSQNWDGNMRTGDMRRFTFEDGDKIVDSGPDWGTGKFNPGGGPPPRRGGRDFGPRRGRGGGYRGGGGGGYRGDSYRGGGNRY